MSDKDKRIGEEEHRDERIEKIGQVTLNQNADHKNIHLLSIIGEIEGHDNLSGNSKTTKYEHILPQLAAIEDSQEIDGVLVILNTMGGDVEAGLAIAEMLASLSKPTVSLVLAPWVEHRNFRPYLAPYYTEKVTKLQPFPPIFLHLAGKNSRGKPGKP